MIEVRMMVSELNSLLGRTATLCLSSGEILKARIEFIDEEDETVMAAVLETSCPDTHRQPCAMHTLRLADIVSARGDQ